jgi:uncharacterized protein (TIGR02597 family)
MSKRALPLSIAAAFGLAITAVAQTVATDPVGFTSVNIGPNSVSALALPLDDIPAFAAAASVVTSTTIQTANAAWTSNAYGPFSSNPHVVRMMSGANKGKQFRIASNTADTLTLVAGQNTSGNAAGDQYRIFPVATLAKLFGQTAPGLNTNVDPELADNILIRVGNQWLTYYNDGSNWLRQGPGSISNNAALLPEQGFLFARRAGSTTFTLTGAVPTTNLKTDLPPNATTSLGNRFPVATNLVGLGLDANAAWNKNADPDQADLFLLRVGNQWLTYFHNGTSWARPTGQVNQNPTIALGASVLIVRRSGAVVTLDQPLPYNLN